MNKRPDTSQQIRRYLNGELDVHAMHLLEKEAQNDPFLAEALEGYEKSGADQQDNLNDIHTRLRKRTDENNRRMVLWRTIAIAASIIIVLSVGGLWLKDKQQINRQIKVSGILKPAPEKTKPRYGFDSAQQAKNSALIAANKNQVANATQIAPINSNIQDLRESHSEPDRSKATDVALAGAKTNGRQNDSSRIANNSLGKVVIIGYGTQKKKDLTGSIASVNSNDLANKGQSVSKVATPGLDVKASGLTVDLTNSEKFNLSANRAITGTVTSKDDGLPIPGVTVKVKGTKLVTKTDSEGKFILNSVPLHAALLFDLIGYSTVELSPKDNLSINVAMETNRYALGEVTVTTALGVKRQSASLGYATANIKDNKVRHGLVSGIVTDKTDGTPIPGAVVKVTGTAIVTQTNSNGEFSLDSLSNGTALVISYVGYTTQNVPIQKSKKIEVALASAGNDLSEVVVTGYSTNKDAQRQHQLARPNNGWSAFRKYIKDNNVSPDGKPGTVKISFVVNIDGTLSDFTIIKSVSAKADSKAVALVKNGTQWIRNSNNKSEKITLKIKFKVK